MRAELEASELAQDDAERDEETEASKRHDPYLDEVVAIAADYARLLAAGAVAREGSAPERRKSGD